MEQTLQKRIQIAAEKLDRLREDHLKAYYRNPKGHESVNAYNWLNKNDITRAADELKALEQQLSLYRMEHGHAPQSSMTYAPRGGMSLAQRARLSGFSFRKKKSSSRKRKSPSRKRKSPSRKRKSPSRKRKSSSRKRKSPSRKRSRRRSRASK